MDEKSKFLCDIKQKSLDFLKGQNYHCAQIVVDVNTAFNRAEVKLIETRKENGRTITITEVL